MQTEHNLLTTDEATRLILKSRHNVYEFGDKANKLLALQARQTAAARSFPNKPIKSNIEHILELKSDRRGLISLTYDLIGNWVKDVMYFLLLEKIHFLLRGSFIRTWKPFLDYYDSLQDPLDKE
ncbi:hypothetical protein F7725_025233 [Dissostichus mawsoni]|uniref:Uncharacterized protein n=1 Tax=Dissostichus mawsoni TaxID=36200 RepID=A0A7J5XBH1_DISMA|nr:hypothetical protein F7725_025233 [Dissostichus mawsoni]